MGQVRLHTTDSMHGVRRFPNVIRTLAPTYPDQVWVADIAYIHTSIGFVYWAVMLDAFTRSVRGWYLSRRLGQELTLAALRQALTVRVPAIHHCD